MGTDPLAQLQYLLPRLTRLWTHLERQKGGIGMRGPGETQIETDRRIIQQKISFPFVPFFYIYHYDSQEIQDNMDRANSCAGFADL